jgi:hypothetical protein
MPALAPFQGLTAPMTAFCTPPKTVPTPLPTRCSCERAYGHLCKRSFSRALFVCKIHLRPGYRLRLDSDREIWLTQPAEKLLRAPAGGETSHRAGMG